MNRISHFWIYEKGKFNILTHLQMLFNSLEFLYFFPVVTVMYFLSPHTYRWAILLVASCFFYMMYIPEYILILFATILIDYLAGIWIYDSSDEKKKRLYLVVSILSTCFILFYFKYFNFFQENVVNLAKALHLNYPLPLLNVILPIGLSFHTFQSLSYVVEVYKGNQKPERNFGIYSLYVMFYPQLVAGPIERPQNVLHQFHEKHIFNYHRVISGLIEMLWGFFKKIVIADRLSVVVNEVYKDPSSQSPSMLFVATIFFAFQIYCDFSGYSDIALGSARVMGFELMKNFDKPYFSQSVTEFWGRWHISLSSWFRDYVYIPLGGNRKGKQRHWFNLLFTFLISGIWHGANWTYMIWGLLNGWYIVLELWIFGKKQTTKPAFLIQILRTIYTFLLIDIAWIFFRANSFSDAILILNKLTTGIASGEIVHLQFLNQYSYSLGLIVILFLMLVEWLIKEESANNFIMKRPIIKRIAIIYFLIFSIIFFGEFNTTEFIYFQF